jgi:RND family efflux transporter MFP subunit
MSPGRLTPRQKKAGALLLALLVLWVGWALQGVIRERLMPEPAQPASPLAVAVETIVPGAFVVERRWRGSVDIDQRALVSAHLSAVLVELPHREGARVESGELLFRLDDAEPQAERQRLAAVIARIGHELDGARRDLERQQALIERRLISRKSLDDAGQRVDMLSAQLAEARASHALVLTRLSYTQARAPFPARVERVHLNPGELATPGKPVLELVADRGFKTVAAVAQADSAWMTVGLPVRLDVPSLGQSWEATIDRIYPALDPGTRNATIAVLFPDSEEALRPGMAVTVHARIAEHASAISVPAQAVGDPSGDPFVYVLQDNTARQRPVIIGPGADGRVLILDGLAAGEIIISTADPRLTDGLTVRPEAERP